MTEWALWGVNAYDGSNCAITIDDTAISNLIFMWKKFDFTPFSWRSQMWARLSFVLDLSWKCLNLWIFGNSVFSSENGTSNHSYSGEIIPKFMPPPEMCWTIYVLQALEQFPISHFVVTSWLHSTNMNSDFCTFPKTTQIKGTSFTSEIAVANNILPAKYLGKHFINI